MKDAPFRIEPDCEPPAGHVVLSRPLTYAECLAMGCSEQEAIEYFKANLPTRLRRVSEQG
jgi:hypothetical protein